MAKFNEFPKSFFIIRPLVACCLYMLLTASCWAQDSSGQFIGKLYTEALGRAPDPSAFANFMTQIQQNGCNLNVAQSVASGILLSSEFDSDYRNSDGSYDNSSRVEILFRALLNREPTSDEYNNANYMLQSKGYSWTQIINSIIDGQEFQGLVQETICKPLQPGVTGAYGWGAGVQLDRSAGHPAGTFTGSTGADLAVALNQLGQNGGGVLTLTPGSMIATYQPIVIPRGVTLETVGNPAATQYGRMARIVRYSNFTNGGLEGDPETFGVVTVAGGGTLQGVWIDGNVTNVRGVDGGCPLIQGTARYCLTVVVQGDDESETYQTLVSNNRITDTDGWSSLVAYGEGEIPATNPNSSSGVCASTKVPVTIVGNLVTAYGTFHTGAPDSEGRVPWSDGISSDCNTVVISNNDIVDATDAGIIVFGPAIGSADTITYQHSHISNNIVINVGNAAYYSINAADAYSDAQTAANYNCVGGKTRDFSGASIQYNYVWTSPGTFVDQSIVLGNVSAGESGDGSLSGSGFTATGNSSGPNSVNATIGLLIAGMCDSNAMTNYLTFNISDHVTTSGCFSGSSTVAVAGYAEGASIPSGYYYFTPNKGLIICNGGNMDHR